MRLGAGDTPVTRTCPRHTPVLATHLSPQPHLFPSYNHSIAGTYQSDTFPSAGVETGGFFFALDLGMVTTRRLGFMVEACYLGVF